MVTPSWPPGRAPNGIVTYTAQMVPAFRARGVRCVLLAWDAPRDTNGRTASPKGDELVDISQFETNRTLLGKAVGRARRLFARNESGDPRFAMIARAVCSAASRFPIELIETEEAFGLAGRIVRLDRVPVVTRLHGPWFLNGEVLGAEKDDAFRRRVEKERIAIAASDAVSAPSQDVLDRTREYYGLPLSEARVIPCPIEPRVGVPLWNLTQADRNRLVFVGRFDRHKGGDVMIDAFAKLAATRPSLCLDFVGPDRGIPGPAGQTVRLADYLQRHISDPAIARQIVIHGPKNANEIDEIRRAGFVTVVPSRYETFGYTAVEALGLGCPLVASETGGLKEIVRDGETGLLCKSGDSQSLAERIDRLLSAPGLAASLGEAGRHDVVRRYSPSSIAEMTLNLYASVIERWGSRSRARGGLSRPSA
jgi:glycosyltransferase involved in cell wall biosynthesis